MSRFCSQLSLLGFISALFINLATAQVATTAVITERATLRLNTLADGLDHPWGLTFINPATLVVSERSGQLRLLQDGKLSPPVKGLPAIDAKGQGGLLDVLYQDEWLYFSYAEPDGKGNNSTAVARANRAIVILEAELGHQHPDVVEARAELAEIERSEGGGT